MCWASVVFLLFVSLSTPTVELVLEDLMESCVFEGAAVPAAHQTRMPLSVKERVLSQDGPEEGACQRFTSALMRGLAVSYDFYLL